MRIGKLAATGLAIAGMIVSATVQAGSTRSEQSVLTGSPASGICSVKVSRKGAAGVFDVTREVLSNGKCVCRVSTGPKSQGGDTEAAIATLLRTGDCANAPLAKAAAGAGAGGGGNAALIVGGLATAVGLGLGLAGAVDTDSPGG